MCQSFYKHNNRTNKDQENEMQFKLLAGQIVSTIEYGHVVQIIHIKGEINGEPGHISKSFLKNFKINISCLLYILSFYSLLTELISNISQC